MENKTTPIAKLEMIENELSSFHVEREAEIHGLILALMARTNVLFLGDPGSGKTKLVTDMTGHLVDAKLFKTLMSEFSVPDDIAGAPSLKALENDIYKRNTSNMLPEADVAYLDEVFKSNSAVLNFLLTAMNEREFYNGGEMVAIPLQTLIGSSNELPEREDGLDAFLDRFVLKFDVAPVTETSNRMRVMDSFLNRKDLKPTTLISMDELRSIQAQVDQVEVPISCRKTLLDIAKDLEQNHINVSARSMNQTLRIIQAQALYEGRSEAVEDDLAVCRHTFWKEPEHERIIYGKILSRISPDKNALESHMSEAMEIYEEFSKTEPVDGNTDKFLEMAQSLTKVKEKMDALRVNIKEKGKPTKDADKFIRTVSNYVRETLRKGMGVDVE